VAMPTEDELKKMPVEHEPKEKRDEEDETTDDEGATKSFPFMLRIYKKNKDGRPDFLNTRPAPFKTMEKK